MPKTNKYKDIAEVEELKSRLAEAEETLHAIKSGAVDALVVSEPNGHKVFTLKGEDYTYRVLVEQMHEGALTFTEEGIILYANKSFANIVQLPLEKVIGSSIYDFVAYQSNNDFASLIKNGKKKSKGSRGEVELKIVTGRKLPIYASINSLQIYEIEAFSMTVLDISQLKIAKKLEESEEKFRTLAENIPTLTWTANADGYIYWYNSRWYEYTGTKPEQMEGWGWQSVHDPKVLPQVLKKWKASIADGESFEMVFPLKGADGIFRPFLTRIIPMRDSENNIIQWFGTNTDITKQKELERQKDEFLGIASHELKTPVTSIKAYGQVLQKMFQKKGDAKSVEQLQKMDAQINKLTNLVEDLLDVTKIQSGRLEFHEDYFDFNELIQETVDELQLTTEKHEIITEFKKTKSIYADKERIGQVLTNLISNAVKYSPHAKKIIIKTTYDNTKVTLCVEDFGVGIPKDKQEKVFEQFFRVSGSKQSIFPGLGLGLYVSSEIIKREGGRIWVESIEGKGSTFCISLPIKKNKIEQQKNTLADTEIQHE
ncbi:MAG: PAS domain-containing sensor histidine kinase [Candidatus Levybacteria bacterium]|nr:PAS domain-containing sensor histidine kinase [Candidatus Levybacteria bacterium]